MKKELPKQYDPKEVEEKIYDFWGKGGFFKPKIQTNKKSFTIVIPPPNVTGTLHMGHALNNTVIDILIRYNRMKGNPTLYQPGTDHAGIATQYKVEQKLAKEGKTRQDLGREKFIEEVWKWKNKYQKRINDQLKTLGCSCDWSRERFTLDKQYSEAVDAAFKHYYDKGWIYQSKRTINWCPRCQTGLSDLEIKYKKENGKLYWLKYGPFVLATARPETKLGDTAVAVHPDDKRYKNMIGKKYKIPGVSGEFEITVVADRIVDPKFGSGAIKVTPAHSVIDFEIAKKNNIPIKQIIDKFGKMMENCGKYAGLSTKKAREEILKDMEKMGLIDHIEDNYEHQIATCYRCGTVLEPIPSKQWFLKMKELAGPAIEVVKSGKIKFYPSRWKRVYLDWLENIEDWCISRQLWWGHRLPVWQSKVKSKNEKVKIYVGEKPPAGWEQSEDVLDTWFSSALWPFAVFGWPHSAKASRGKPSDLNYFYPTNVLSTARDIIFLWVARMIFSGLELTGKIPFSQVYIHPTVLTEEGKRMSKSLGTGVDPLDLIEKYGADATRFGIAWQLTGLQDLRFKEDTILASRNFCNKIWNSARFVKMNLANSKLKSQNSKPQPKTQNDEQILNQLNQLIKSTDSDINKYRFGHAAQNLYHFFWNEFCDKYLEISKKQMQDSDLKENTQQILLYTLSLSLRLLHPFIPFVTEEIWQNLGYKKPLIVSKWPK